MAHFSLKIRELHGGYFHLKMLIVLQRRLMLISAVGHYAEHGGFPI